MARYQDYVKDDIVDEIDEAAEKQQQRKENADDGFELPEQFRGKSAEEIAKSYVELQKLNSKQAQDLGSMRKTVDELVALQSQTFRPPEESEEEADEPVTADSLWDDTEGTISRVAEKTVGGRLEAIEQKLEKSALDERLRQFEDNHPDWQQTAQDPDFVEWVKGSSYRQRLAAAADQYDLDAAEDLFGMYEDHIGVSQKQEKEAKRRADLDAASLESSSPNIPEPEETFSRKNILEAKVAAKRGDASAREWLAVNGDAIREAYATGRITD